MTDYRPSVHLTAHLCIITRIDHVMQPGVETGTALLFCPVPSFTVFGPRELSD